jgi:hypothetical protein
VTGYPDKAVRDRAARGEVALGGCFVTGLEPKWVIIW